MVSLSNHASREPARPEAALLLLRAGVVGDVDQRAERVRARESRDFTVPTEMFSTAAASS